MDDEPARAEEDFLPPPPEEPVPGEEPEEEGDEDEDDEEEDEAKNEDDGLVSRAQRIIEKITTSPENPNPILIHALASLFETQESRFMEENGHASSNSRSSHTIGRLGNLVRENDDFFELISSTYLSDMRYSASIQAAVARLLLSCSVTWIYPHVFDEAVMENIKDRVMDESATISGEDHNPKCEPGRSEASDSQMLKTYSTGLLAYFLAGGGPIVEDVLTSRLSAKLMRYIRIRVLGETSASQKDSGHITEIKNTSSAIALRSREESRSKTRPVLETSLFDDSRVVDGISLDGQSTEKDQGKNELFGEDRWDGGCEPPENSDGDDRWHACDLREGRNVDENGRDDSARRKHNRGWAKTRGKGRSTEVSVENEQALTSPGSGSRFGPGRSGKDRSSSKTDSRKVPDAKKNMGRITSDICTFERGDNDDCFQECKVGATDISDLVKKAVRAAEAEARAANAPEEAVKAAGDAAAEVVKSASLEEFKSSGNEEAAVLAASKAASTVIDASNAVEVSRSSMSVEAETGNPNITEQETNVDVEDYFIPDTESVAQLREKYCIQCLESLGEYVEVLGPVLHEKGVDVCLELLQRNSKQTEPSEVGKLLPDILKLICALAAHRKFAALFVDRGGMQKLLAVPRVAQTHFGLSSCLFTIGSLQGVMERVCALPSDVGYQLVELSLQLLQCPHDQARKNAALFFSAAFIFRTILDAFDSQDGLQKVLGLLNDAACVRSGVNSGALGLSNGGFHRNERLPAEVLTSSEKQIAYHTCVALRQYFRAHLLLLVDSIRPSKSNRGAARNASSARAAYKPLDISNESMDAVFLQLQKDRKLGAAFVRSRWSIVEKFLASNGHYTMLELCQAPPDERYLRDLLQYALGVLHIVTLVPSSRKMIVSATLSNNNSSGISVILDAASVASSYVDPEIIQPALNVLVNLVCPPPSISNKPPLSLQGQQSTNGPNLETRERNMERNISDRAMTVSTQTERGGESATVERGGTAGPSSQPNTSNAQAPPPTPVSGLVGDRRISLGPGAGCAGLATQLEQGYHQAREAVRANSGIKVLLNLLQPRIYQPPAALDCLRALACRVLLGLARDPAIAHILTKLQVGKKLSELIRDSGSQTNGTEQGRWQTELSQAAIELIGIVTNSGRASTLAATDAATPTLRRIERAAIAAATPITYHSKELLLLIHEHLQASGLGATASMLLKEGQLAPLPSLSAASSLQQQASTQEGSAICQWPAGRSPSGFLSNNRSSKLPAFEEDSVLKFNPNYSFSKRRQPVFSPSFSSQSRSQAHMQDSHPQSSRKSGSVSKQSAWGSVVEPPSESSMKPSGVDTEAQCKTPISIPMKRKLSELKDPALPSGKRINTSEQGFKSPVAPTPNTLRKSILTGDAGGGFLTPIFTPSDCPDESQYCNSHLGLTTPMGLQSDPQTANTERPTLDSLVIQYLKHQHRQCPAPITTLPPLSLLHPHVCPEPRRSLEAPSNVTARLAARELKAMFGGVHGNRRDRQLVYSRFRPWRTSRDDTTAPLTSIAFLRDTSLVAVGSHSGELKIFDTNTGSPIESCHSHQTPVTVVQSYHHSSGGGPQLLLSSSSMDVRLWDATSVSGGPTHPFEACKAARFSNAGDVFAALSAEQGRREILLFDIQTCQEVSKLSYTLAGSTGRGSSYSPVHFSPSDVMLMWNGVLWDKRQAEPVRRFDQFTDYGGGGFHPNGNEAIINSEVWDLRKFRLLRSVASLDQTTITFNARGDVIYANLRRNIEDVMSAFHTRRAKHPLFSAFRTVDAISYLDIATIPVDRCVLDFAAEPTDSFVGLVTLDDQEDMFASARVYEIGRRRPTDDDSDPDDAESDDDGDDDDDDDEDDIDIEPILGHDFDVDGDDLLINDDDDDSATDDEDDDDDDDDDGDFVMDDGDFGDGGMLDGDDDDDDDDGDDGHHHMMQRFSSSDDDEFGGNGFGY